jgi:hypothetical protein
MKRNRCRTTPIIARAQIARRLGELDRCAVGLQAAGPGFSTADAVKCLFGELVHVEHGREAERNAGARFFDFSHVHGDKRGENETAGRQVCPRVSEALLPRGGVGDCLRQNVHEVLIHIV